MGPDDTKRKLYLRNRHFLVVEKYVEDDKQDEKHTPDLLEGIGVMRPTFFVKEESRTTLFKMIQLRSKINDFRVSIFLIPEIRCFPAGGQCQPSC